ncbi:MAG: hypothetical protein RLZZ480_917 [Candidatus Parcubacteria bacterium]|jgi:hypothetical protein
MYHRHILSVALVAIVLLSPLQSFAKGGNGTTSTKLTLPTPTTSSGPCSLDNYQNSLSLIETATTREIDQELVHTNLPGGATVHLVRDKITNMLYISNVCLEEGWAISQYKIAGSWGKDQGVDITVSYNGIDAVRYRMMGGGQGIRFDYY